MSARGRAVFILSEMQLLGLIDLAIAYLKQPGGRMLGACATAPAIKLRFLNIPATFIRHPSTECAGFHLPAGGCDPGRNHASGWAERRVGKEWVRKCRSRWW